MKRKLADFTDLTPAEQRLRDEVGLGEVVVFGDSVPAADADSPVITAAFLRYLILGGCKGLPHPVPETGVQIMGARITGKLTLEGCRVPRDIALMDCRIDEIPILQSARIDNLFLNASAVPGLTADGMEAQGGVFLRGATVTGEVRLLGATLGGGLDASRATLTASEGGVALSADRMEAKGNVFLSAATVTGEVRLLGATLGGGLDANGATLTASEGGVALSADRMEAKGGVFLRETTVTGAVRLPGATLGGDLDASGATLTASEGGVALGVDRMDAKGGVFLRGATVTGEVRLPGATLGGDLDATGATHTASEGGFALKLQGARVAGGILLRFKSAPTGTVDLNAAHVVNLLDPETMWPEKGKLLLDGFTYDRFVGEAPLSAKARIDWLERQRPDHLTDEFRPQPWEQCARVLRESGHGDAARRVLIRKEALQRKARRTRDWVARRYSGWLWRVIADGFLWATTDYGRRPLKAAMWLSSFLLLGTVVFDSAADRGAIKPNSAFILRAPEWAACAADYIQPSAKDPAIRWRPSDRSQFACFQRQPEAASYPAFNAFIYSADTLLPIVSMEMQEFWIPANQSARRYLWLHIAMGWALSLLAVAGFSGLIKTDNS